MKGTRHSEGQIIAILKQGEAGLTTKEITVTPLSSAQLAGGLACTGRLK